MCFRIDIALLRGMGGSNLELGGELYFSTTDSINIPQWKTRGITPGRMPGGRFPGGR